MGLHLVVDDLDGDGLLDIVTGATQPAQAIWLRNIGKLLFTPYVIEKIPTWSLTVGCVEAGAAPSDCHNILLGGDGAILHCHLLKRTEALNFSFSCSAIAVNTGQVQSLRLADLDLDRAPDLVIGSYLDRHQTSYLLNTNQQGTFGSIVLISDVATRNAVPADFDGDYTRFS